MKCKICGGKLSDWEYQCGKDRHYNKDTCIELLQNTLNGHIKNTEILEETIGNLISALVKIENQPSNILTKYSVSIATEALENL